MTSRLSLEYAELTKGIIDVSCTIEKDGMVSIDILFYDRERKRQGRRTYFGIAAEVLLENGINCYYCGIELYPGGLHNYDDSLQFEHKLPKSRGGRFNKNNIVPSCRYCNLSKGTKTSDEYFEWHRMQRRAWFYDSLSIEEQIAYSPQYEDVLSRFIYDRTI